MALNYAGIDVIRESSKIEDLTYLLVRVFIYLFIWLVPFLLIT